MTARKSLAVVAGGRTPEHDISLESGAALVGALSRSDFDAKLVPVSTSGTMPSACGLAPCCAGFPIGFLQQFDYVLPLVHGLHGEGFRGLLEAFDVPVLGESATASAIALDKPTAKRLLKEAGLPVTTHVLLTRRQLAASPREAVTRIAHEIGFPCFVKPASGVASVGAGVVWAERELMGALVRAASFDTRVLVEPYLDAREIEVDVVAGVASMPGELVYRAEFHDLATKRDASKLELILPAMVTERERDALQALAVAACSALGIEMVGRVEILRDRNTRELVVNEVNAVPVFTPASVFPRLWESSGVTLVGLVERLATASDAAMRDRFRTRRLPSEIREGYGKIPSTDVRAVGDIGP